MSKINPKLTIVTILFILISSVASWAQFATGGTGKYQRQIYWLPWYFDNVGVTGLISIQSGNTLFTKDNQPTKIVRNGVYTWKLSPNIRIIGTLSNVDSNNIVTDKIDSYERSGLQRMYEGFINKKMALNVSNRKTTINLLLSFELFDNTTNTWKKVDPKNHGIVVADSESMDHESYSKINNQEGREFLSCLVDANSAWYLIDKPTVNYENKPFASNNNYTITSSIENGLKKIKINNEGGASQEGATVVMYAKGANEFKDLTFEGRGHTHIMLGYFINHDPSNANGYNQAMHFQELLSPGAQNGEGGTFYELGTSNKFTTINNLSIPGAKLSTNVYFGKAPNVEAPYSDSAANLDALTQGNLRYKIDDTLVSYNIEYTNNYNRPAFIYAFIDRNKDNIFSQNEAAQVIVAPANSVNETVTLVWNNMGISAGDYVVRFRITTDTLLDNANTANLDERSIGLARNGEVTDRIVKIIPSEALPLSLVKFVAYATPQNNTISWETHKEYDIVKFVIQRSANGTNWENIGTTPAKNLISNQYDFIDMNPLKSSYYRLKIEESDKVEYTKVIALNRDNIAKNDWSIQNRNVSSNLIINAATAITLNIYNSTGSFIQTLITNQNNNNIDVSTLPSGVYIITDGYQTEKFIKK